MADFVMIWRKKSFSMSWRHKNELLDDIHDDQRAI